MKPQMLTLSIVIRAGLPAEGRPLFIQGLAFFSWDATPNCRGNVETIRWKSDNQKKTSKVKSSDLFCDINRKKNVYTCKSSL